MMNLLQTFAQDTLSDPMSYSYETSDVGAASMYGDYFGVIVVASLVTYILQSIALWKVFTKAGKPGWAALIPVYNYIVMLQVVGRPVWWILLLLLSPIPFVGLIVSLALHIVVSNDMSKSFGRDMGMTVLLVLLPLIGYFVLGYGSATYRGPAALQSRDGDGTDQTPPATPAI